jgi:hypothetical protein
MGEFSGSSERTKSSRTESSMAAEATSIWLALQPIPGTAAERVGTVVQ